MSVRRYLKLLAVQLRSSFLLDIQYRSDFWLDALISVFYTVAAVAPIWVVFQGRTQLGGFSLGEALLVSAWFTLLEGILQGAINPSLLAVVEHIRKGTLDFVLLKPADAQFLVSTARFDAWRATNVISAAVLLGAAFTRLGYFPSWLGIVKAVALLAIATVMLYSLWILTVSLAFYVVKVDNLTYLFQSIFDAARWPVTVFPAAVRFLFTFVLPLAVMTTFPAMALTDSLPLSTFFGSLGGGIAIAALARFVWSRSLSRYTSASS